MDRVSNVFVESVDSNVIESEKLGFYAEQGFMLNGERLEVVAQVYLKVRLAAGKRDELLEEDDEEIVLDKSNNQTRAFRLFKGVKVRIGEKVKTVWYEGVSPKTAVGTELNGFIITNVPVEQYEYNGEKLNTRS